MLGNEGCSKEPEDTPPSPKAGTVIDSIKIGKKTIEHVEYHPNGSEILVATSTSSSNYEASLWSTSDLKKPKQKINDTKSSVIQYSPKGTYLYGNGSVWNKKGHEIQKVSSSHWLGFYPGDDEKFLTHEGTKISIHKTKTKGETLATFNINNSSLVAAAKRDSRLFQFYPDSDGVVVIDVWNLESKQISKSFSISTSSDDGGFSPDGSQIIVGTKIFDISGTEKKEVTSNFRGSPSYSRDGSKILSKISGTDSVAVWNAKTVKKIKTFKIEGSLSITGISPNGSKCITKSSSNTYYIWDTSTGIKLKSFTEGNTFQGYSPDGSKLLFSKDSEGGKDAYVIIVKTP